MDSIKTRITRFLYNMREFYYKLVLRTPRIYRCNDTEHLEAYNI